MCIALKLRSQISFKNVAQSWAEKQTKQPRKLLTSGHLAFYHFWFLPCQTIESTVSHYLGILSFSPNCDKFPDLWQLLGLTTVVLGGTLI